MNETILNGLLNLFAIFASSVRIEREQASRAVHSYLSSHFGVRSHKEYIELYNALRDMYDDSLFVIDKEQIVRNICEQMKVKLRAEEQLLLLIRFVEFAYTNSEEADRHWICSAWWPISFRFTRKNLMKRLPLSLENHLCLC